MQWSNSLATGVGEIDSQHKELIERVNKLLEACNQGRGKEEVGGIIKFLEDYVVTHFGTEERFMARYAYPEAAAHKQQHAEFVKNFGELKSQFAADGPSLQFVMRVNRVVVDWLINHISKVDKALGAYLKTRM
ncbi:MAG: bacteriohemerythrin [Clostridia bacterium]|nr:MAG: bacteriohemerythrin [Clostridia bacterium]